MAPRYGDNPFFPNAGFTPRPETAGHYRLDLDASERHTRFGTGVVMEPYPYIIGAISGFMPMQNMMVWSGMYGKEPSGPGPGSQPDPLNRLWQILIPGLQKSS